MVIGQEVWVNSVGGWRAAAFSDLTVVDVLHNRVGSPTFWETLGLPSLEGYHATSEIINDVPALHYDLREVLGLLPTSRFFPEELEGVTVDRFGMWLAEDGRWPVAMNVSLTVTDTTAFAEIPGIQLEDDQQLTIEVNVEIFDVNNFENLVDLPLP